MGPWICDRVIITTVGGIFGTSRKRYQAKKTLATFFGQSLKVALKPDNFVKGSAKRNSSSLVLCLSKGSSIHSPRFPTKKRKMDVAPIYQVLQNCTTCERKRTEAASVKFAGPFPRCYEGLSVLLLASIDVLWL